MDLSNILWRSDHCLINRYTNTLARFRVIRGAVANRDIIKAPNSSEFLELNTYLDSLSPGEYEHILTSPYGHYWSRIAYDLVSSFVQQAGIPPSLELYADQIGSDKLEDLFAFHLDQYKRFVLSAALNIGEDIQWSTPLPLDLPTGIPGTRYCIPGEGRIFLKGIVNRELVVDGDDYAHQYKLEKCPVAGSGQDKMPLQPYGFNAPGFTPVPAACSTTLGSQAEYAGLVESALNLVAVHQPDTYAQIKQFVRWVSINPVSDMRDTNFMSDSRMTGAFAVLGISNPWIVASASIHEYHHNRLFCIEEQSSILDAEHLGTDDDASYFSPWRDEPRPLRGILHGLYVYLPEMRFWLACAQSDDTPEDALRIARDRLVRSRLQVELAIDVLKSNAKFTEIGIQLFEQLVTDAKALCELSREVVAEAEGAIYIENDGSVVPKRSEIDSRLINSREAVVEHMQCSGYDEAIATLGF